MRRPLPARVLLAAVALLSFARPALLQPPSRAVTVALAHDPLPWDQGATGLGLALRRLGTTGRVLYVTAHPDDEDNALLVALSRGHGLHVALLTITRGEGGLNELGPELFQELSVLRTEELQAVHRHDGVRQLFGRAGDFGYSFSVEECSTRWGREQTLADVVAVVRRVRPDVMVTLPLQEASGGAAHSAAAQLAAEAFRAAGDAARFPEQLAAGLRPWQARKLYESATGGGEFPAGVLTLDTSGSDPLLGMSWAELGSIARAAHRSQGTSQVKVALGEGRSRLRLALAEPAVTGTETFPLDGIDASVGRLAERFGQPPSNALRAAQGAALRARERFDARRPDAVLPALLEGLQALHTAVEAARRVADRPELVDRLEEEQADFARAIMLAGEVAVEAVAETADLLPGGRYRVTTRVRHAPQFTAQEVTLRAPAGWSVQASTAAEAAAAPPGTLAARHDVSVPAQAPPTQPHWRAAGDRHTSLDEDHAHLPWRGPELAAVVRLATPAGPLEAHVPVYAQRAGPDGGERRTLVRVVPALSLRVRPEVMPFSIHDRSARELRVSVTSAADGSGSATVALDAPGGWEVTPPQAKVSWARAGEDVAARFSVRPPAGARAGAADLVARAVAAGRTYREGVALVGYGHVQERPLLRPAVARALVLDLRVPTAARVGYVMGAGDVVADAIRSLGVPVRMLTAEDLSEGDLSSLSTIVLGVRAYHARADLRRHHRRLMRFAEAGGHVVVQLSRAEFNQTAPLLAGAASPARAPSPFAPFPARVGTGRVTDETARVRVLLPAHPLLSRPNAIGPANFADWAQERGSFLLEASAARYRELLASADPFPQNAGEKKGLLVEATVGRGSWAYVGLNLFRQLYVGTPGAYRLMANLVGRPRGQAAGGPARGTAR